MLYKCKPERSVAQMRIIVLLGLGIPLICFTLGSAVPKAGSYVKLFGFAVICAFIMVLVRFVLSEYEYSVDGESFAVARVTGRRNTVMCRIDLTTAISLLPKKEYDALPGSEKAIVKYSLNQNIKAASYVFLCDFNGKRTMIEFEPNEAFVGIVNKQIDEAKRRSSRESADKEDIA